MVRYTTNQPTNHPLFFFFSHHSNFSLTLLTYIPPSFYPPPCLYTCLLFLPLQIPHHKPSLHKNHILLRLHRLVVVILVSSHTDLRDSRRGINYYW